MKRREFVVGLIGASFASRSAYAQSAMPVLGYLSSRSRADVIAPLQEFQRGLAEAGYVDGTTVTIEYCWAEGRYEELPRLAAELVERRPAVIATNGNVAAIAAKAATSTIPIVFAAGGNPVSLGLVASLGQPGGNVTGVTHLIAELSGKRLELLRELAPKAVRIGVLVNPNYPAGVAEGGELQARGQALGLTIHVLNAAAESDFAAVFAVAAAQHIEALLVAGDPLLIDLREALVRTAAPYAIPAIYVTRDFVEAGGLMSYGASIGDSYRKAGAYAGQILKGAKPADLPVLQPTKFELVINLKTAKALGIAVPLTLQAQADEVIE